MAAHPADASRPLWPTVALAMCSAAQLQAMQAAMQPMVMGPGPLVWQALPPAIGTAAMQMEPGAFVVHDPHTFTFTDRQVRRCARMRARLLRQVTACRRSHGYLKCAHARLMGMWGAAARANKGWGCRRCRAPLQRDAPATR